MASGFYTLAPLLNGLKTDYPKERLTDGDATIATDFVTDEYRVIQRDMSYDGPTIPGTAGDYAHIRHLALETGSLSVCGTRSELSKVSSGVATSISSGYSNAKWHMFPWKKRMFISRFDNSGPVASAFYSYDGTTFASTPYTVGGATNYKVTHCVSHRSRLYLVLEDPATNEIDCWYSGVNSVTGALTVFDASGGSTGLFLQGGFLLAVGSLSRMSTAGDQSQFVLVSNLGEVLIYNGSYPGGADWTLVRRITVPKPIALGRYTNSVLSANGDVYILTLSGVISLNKILAGDPHGVVAPIARSLRNAWNAQRGLQDSGNHSTHDLCFHETRKLLLATIPGTTDYTSLGGVYCTNMVTGATTRWNFPVASITQTSASGYSFESVTQAQHTYWRSVDDIYYIGATDYQSMDWELATSWSTLGRPYVRKTIKAVRVRMQTNQNRTVNATVYIDADYQTSSNGYTYDITTTEASTAADPWIPVQASGENFRIRLTGTENSSIEIGTIDIKFESGGSI